MFSPGSLCENNGRSYEKRICGTFMRRASFYWKSPAAQKKINVIFQQRQGTDLFFSFPLLHTVDTYIKYTLDLGIPTIDLRYVPHL